MDIKCSTFELLSKYVKAKNVANTADNIISQKYKRVKVKPADVSTIQQFQCRDPYLLLQRKDHKYLHPGSWLFFVQDAYKDMGKNTITLVDVEQADLENVQLLGLVSDIPIQRIHNVYIVSVVVSGEAKINNMSVPLVTYTPRSRKSRMSIEKADTELEKQYDKYRIKLKCEGDEHMFTVYDSLRIQVLRRNYDHLSVLVTKVL